MPAVYPDHSAEALHFRLGPTFACPSRCRIDHWHVVECKRQLFLSHGSGDADVLQVESCRQQRRGLRRSFLSMQRHAAFRLTQSSFTTRTRKALLNTRLYSQPPKNSNTNGPTDAPWLVPDEPVPARPSWILASSSLLRVVLVPGMLDTLA